MKLIPDSLYKSVVKNKLVEKILNKKFKKNFSSSAIYWENRYANHGTSGNGSYGNIALYKAGIINRFITGHDVKDVLELGCGDGNQLQLLTLPKYIGVDVSGTAIRKCQEIFKDDLTKRFFNYDPLDLNSNLRSLSAELVLSLDVIYHLLEDHIYENYMRDLFALSFRYVIIYAWDIEAKQRFHVRHRKFSDWVQLHECNWELIERIQNKEAPTCDFFIYQKKK